MRTILRAGAEAALASEPDLTKWDSIVGDGDCGETVALGSKGKDPLRLFSVGKADSGPTAVLKALDDGLGQNGDAIEMLRSLTHIIDGVLPTSLVSDDWLILHHFPDSMGGTLGAIFSIFLAALTSETRDAAEAESTENFKWGEVAVKALATLQRSTAARKGHRTVMDALIPLAEEMATTEDFSKAVAACKAGGEGTVSLAPKLGRATYVGEREGGLPPDPGAMSVVRAMEGILKTI